MTMDWSVRWWSRLWRLKSEFLCVSTVMVYEKPLCTLSRGHLSAGTQKGGTVFCWGSERGWSVLYWFVGCVSLVIGYNVAVLSGGCCLLWWFAV